MRDTKQAARLFAEAVECYLKLSPVERGEFTRGHFRPPRFFWLCVRASILTFIILAYMPTEPLSIPLAFGGGVAVAYITL
jgi:hypothetical protein